MVYHAESHRSIHFSVVAIRRGRQDFQVIRCILKGVRYLRKAGSIGFVITSSETVSNAGSARPIPESENDLYGKQSRERLDEYLSYPNSIRPTSSITDVDVEN
jgi:hypothetical protein